MPRNAEPTWDSGRVKDLLSTTGGRADSDLRVTPHPCHTRSACPSSQSVALLRSTVYSLFLQMEKMRRQDQYAADLRAQIAAKAMATAKSVRPTHRNQARLSVGSICQSIRRSASGILQMLLLRSSHRQQARRPTSWQRRLPRSRRGQAPPSPVLRRRERASESSSSGARLTTGAHTSTGLTLSWCDHWHGL